MLRRFLDWLSLADYDAEKAAATRALVKRYSRRNVSVQNGQYMSDEDLARLSKAGDDALCRLAQLQR